MSWEHLKKNKNKKGEKRKEKKNCLIDAGLEKDCFLDLCMIADKKWISGFLVVLHEYQTFTSYQPFILNHSLYLHYYFIFFFGRTLPSLFINIS